MSDMSEQFRSLSKETESVATRGSEEPAPGSKENARIRFALPEESRKYLFEYYQFDSRACGRELYDVGQRAYGLGGVGSGYDLKLKKFF